MIFEELPKSNAEIITQHAPFSMEFSNQVSRFFDTLREETEQMQLGLGQIMASRTLSASLDNEGNISGIAGAREKGMTDLFFMVVGHQYQGQGLGRRLTRAITKIQPRNRLLMLTVFRANVKARQIYKTENFITVHRHRDTAYMLYRNALGKKMRLLVVAFLTLRHILD